MRSQKQMNQELLFNLRALCALLRVTVAQMEDESGMGANSLGNIEAGSSPQIDKLLAASAYFGVNFGTLIGENASIHTGFITGAKDAGQMRAAFIANVRMLCERQGINEWRLLESVELSKDTLQRIEAGATPTVYKCGIISAALDAGIDALCGLPLRDDRIQKKKLKSIADRVAIVKDTFRSEGFDTSRLNYETQNKLNEKIGSLIAEAVSGGGR
jgi:transcriptional regulator with XRE-family HTH domain